jgi:hypothetical protein
VHNGLRSEKQRSNGCRTLRRFHPVGSQQMSSREPPPRNPRWKRYAQPTSTYTYLLQTHTIRLETIGESVSFVHARRQHGARFVLVVAYSLNRNTLLGRVCLHTYVHMSCRPSLPHRDDFVRFHGNTIHRSIRRHCTISDMA